MTYKDILKSPKISKYSNSSTLNCQIIIKTSEVFNGYIRDLRFNLRLH